MYHHHRHHRAGAALACALLAGAPTARAQAQGAAPAEAELPALPPIVINATKAGSASFETPASVSAVSGVVVEQQHVQSLADIATRTPGVFFNDPSYATPRITIRGLGFSDDMSDSDSTSTVLDGVPVNAIMLGGLYDLEQIEILRGPQSVLYGQGSMGGIVALRSRDPGFDFGGSAQLDLGSRGRRRASLGVDVPLSDRTALRIALTGENADGYVDNLVLGRSDTTGWRNRFAKLKLLHHDAAGGEWRLNFQHAGHRSRNDVFAAEELALAHQSVGTDPARLDTDATLVTGGYTRRLADGGRLDVAIGGESTRRSDWYPAWVFGAPTGFEGMRTRQWSLEARLRSAPAAPHGLDWTAGAYLARATKDAPYLNDMPAYALRSETTAQVRGDVAAVFGELGWRVDAHWRLAGALRLQRDRRRMDWYSDQRGMYDSNGDGVPDTPYAGTDALHGQKIADTVVLPRLTLEWQPGEQLFGWATLARGYKSSGFNIYAYDPQTAATPYAPEYAEYVELGGRWRTPGRAWEASAVLYTTRLRDMQVIELEDGGILRTTNAGKAHNLGAELSATWRPSSAWEFGAFAGLVQARYDHYVNVGVDYAGTPFPSTPRSSFGLSARWRPAPQWDADLSVRRIGAYVVYPANTVRNPAYTLVDAQLTRRFGAWTLGVYGRNLTNAGYLTRSISTPSGLWAVAAPPRTFGVRLAYDF